jgi:hypothetical protein
VVRALVAGGNGEENEGFAIGLLPFIAVGDYGIAMGSVAG